MGYSKFALFFCYIIMGYSAFVFYPKWQKEMTEATLSWDVSGYYMYLPALFIYKDIKQCTFKDSIIQKYSPTLDFQQAFRHEKSGNYVMKYSSGQAIVMFPFFVIAHTWASISNTYPNDGFSYPYQVSIGVGMFLLALLGLYFLRKILLLYFSEKVTAITLLLLVIGTNYLNYSAIDQALTHNALFTIYVLIIWNTIVYYKNHEIKSLIYSGLLCGLATLIRPTEIISILIPLLWGLNNVEQIKDRVTFIINNFSKAILFAACFFAVVFIQPMYWKLVSNEWLVYSYQDQGFSWLRPHVKDYMFSYRCGWIRYCPMMILPFLGIIPLFKQKINFIPVVLLIFLSLYIVTAWDVWDYGSTAGRAMVQYYPLLSFPFAALISYVNQKWLLKLFFYPIVVLFVYLNIWWVYQAHKGSVHVSEVSKEYYWKMVGRWTATDDDTKLIDNKHSFTGIMKNPTTIYENFFENDTSQNAVNIEDNTWIKLNDQFQSTAKYVVENPQNNQEWLRVFANFKCYAKEWDVWKQAQFTLKFSEGNTEIQSNMIRVFRFLYDGAEKEIYLDAKCPSKWTNVSIEVWNANSHRTLLIDNLRVVTFDE